MFTFDEDWCIGFQHQKKLYKSTLQHRHLFQDQKQKKHYKGYSLKSHIYEILKENSFSHILCQEKDFTSKEFRKIGKGYFIWRFVKFVAESNGDLCPFNQYLVSWQALQGLLPLLFLICYLWRKTKHQGMRLHPSIPRVADVHHAAMTLFHQILKRQFTQPVYSIN